MLDNKKQLLEFLNSILKPNHAEKKKYGEVFTPLTLVEEMLNKLPNHVWSDPSLKWLDPCVGSGNFMVCVYYRLMEGLKDAFPEVNERKEHIISNMLHMVELNAKNVYTCQKIFGPCIQIHHGDALTLDTQGETFGLSSFDVVVGNPPYNDGSGNKGKGHTLWTKFIEKAIQTWCKEGGYVCMVHPSLWRQYGHEMYELIASRQIQYLEIHNEKDGMKTFQCNTRYDWYVLKNVPIARETIVKDQDGKEHVLDLREWNFLPNSMFGKIKELLAQPNEERVNIIHDRSNYGTDKQHISKVKTDKHIYPVIYSIHQGSNPVLQWSSRNDRGHYGITKIILRKATPVTGILYDAKGYFSMTEWVFGICIDNDVNAQRILCVLLSPTFTKVMKSISLRNELNISVLKQFKNKWWDHPMFSDVS